VTGFFANITSDLFYFILLSNFELNLIKFLAGQKQL
jgi:hypothetical protein